MADLSDETLGGVIEAWNRFRNQTERLAREIGEALREVLPEDDWDRLDAAQKPTALEEARRLIHERHGLVRDT